MAGVNAEYSIQSLIEICWIVTRALFIYGIVLCTSWQRGERILLALCLPLMKWNLRCRTEELNPCHLSVKSNCFNSQTEMFSVTSAMLMVKY